MITERVQQSYTSAKYYQFASILEHMIDCYHTIVSDETNPYRPPLAWLTRKQPKPPDDELFLDLMDECSKDCDSSNHCNVSTRNNTQLSLSVRTRLERCSKELREEIVSRTKNGCSPLFVACKSGLINIARYLIDTCNANIEQRGQYETLEDHHIHSVTPLWVASVSGRLEVVQLLIDRGANINSVSDTGSTPLRSVCFLCKDDDGISVEDQDQQPSDFQENDIFHLEAQPENTTNIDVYIRIVQLLIDKGADVTKPNYNGGTCLINSFHNYHLAKYILDHGADVNAADNQSKTALHYAVQQGRLEVVKLLIQYGADPYLKANPCYDDALQLCCIGGHEDIFNYLIGTFQYSNERLVDAYRLLGSSILELHYDLTKVRRYWNKSLELMRQKRNMTPSSSSSSSSISSRIGKSNNNEERCDIRRLKAFGDMLEFENELELQALSVEDFRIQSLLISERVLGSNHRETIQRLLYRGTFYINSLRPDHCINLWIYALKLRLESESIFHFESIFAAQALSKLFLDLFGQRQHQHVRFQDVADVLNLLVSRLDEFMLHLSWRPRSCLHEDIFDLLLGIIVNLLLTLKYLAKQPLEFEQFEQLVDELVGLNPRSSDGSSLLHICISPSVFNSDAVRSLSRCKQDEQDQSSQLIAVGPPVMSSSRSENSQDLDDTEQRQQQLQPQQPDGDGRCSSRLDKQKRNSPLVDMIEALLDHGLDIDQTNSEGLSALQVFCLNQNSIKSNERRQVMKLLVQRGAHVDRRTLAPGQGELIRQSLREAGVNPFDYVSLACLSARKVAELKNRAVTTNGLASAKLDLFDEKCLTPNLREMVAIH